MNLQLSDKLALVSGSTKGIGLAIATGLAREGARHSPPIPQAPAPQGALAKSLKPRGANHPKVLLVDHGPRRRRAGSDEAVAMAADILVTTYGIEPTPFETTFADSGGNDFGPDVTVLSARIEPTTSLLEKMKQKNWGRIVFISSESGVQIPAEMIHYGMTKTAQRSRPHETCPAHRRDRECSAAATYLFRAWSEFVAGCRGKPFIEFEKEFFASVRPSSLLKRFASTEEVANLVVYASAVRCRQP